MVMPSNQTGIEVGLLAAKYPGRIGHLYGPGGQREPWPEVPYALDNGAWPAFKNGQQWEAAPWMELLRWAVLSGQKPLWAVVPDAVGDREKTLGLWGHYVLVVRSHGFRPAFAVQNGMTFDDVPDNDCMLFIGGDDDFKAAAIPLWCKRFPGRVHVGRVNTWDRLVACWRAGAASIDGTGWFFKNKGRGGGGQNADLKKFLKETTRHDRDDFEAVRL